MFFDIYDDLYLYFIAKGKMPFLSVFILSLKIFWNLSLLTFFLSSPYIVFLFFTH